MTSKGKFLKSAAVCAPLAFMSVPAAFADTVPHFNVDSIQTDVNLASKLPPRLSKAGVLTVGSDTAYAPWEFISEEDSGTVQGIDVDIAKAIAKTLGLRLDFQTSQFDAILPALGTKYDIGISAFTITNERLGAVDFVSYSRSGALWAVKSGNPSKFDPNDICGRTIAMQTGTDVERVARQVSETCVNDGKKAIDMLPFSSEPEALTRVATGGADATASGSATIGYAVKQSNEQLEVMKPVGRLAIYDLNGIAVAKKDRVLSEVIAEATNKLIKDGTITRICELWGVEDAVVPIAEINPKAND